VLFRRKRK